MLILVIAPSILSSCLHKREAKDGGVWMDMRVSCAGLACLLGAGFPQALSHWICRQRVAERKQEWSQPPIAHVISRWVGQLMLQSTQRNCNHYHTVSSRQMKVCWACHAARLGCPRSTVEKGPQSNESYERENGPKTLETVPFQPCFGCTETFLKVLSNQYCQATRAMRAKQVVTVPLQPYFGFH